MKGAVESVLPLVLGVIIAGAVLVIGFGIMGRAKGGVEDIWNTGANFQQRLDAMDSLYRSCNDWMTGSERYSADAILNTYKLPDRMRPYRKVWDACGRDLEEVAQKCYAQTEGDNRRCAGKGYILSSYDAMTNCLSTCSVIKDIYSKCEVSCKDNVVTCFEYIIKEGTTSDFVRGNLDFISTHTLERACE